MELRNIRLVTIGCSAGGIEALKNILPLLPADYEPSVVVIQHIGNQVRTTLAEFFASICGLNVKEAEDKEPLRPGTIYFAPSSYHLLLESDLSFALSVDPPVHYVRPAIDVFMESAAPILKDKLVGVVLSGANHDGASGLKRIADYGGITLVQDPKTADFPTMPAAALEGSVTSKALSLGEIAKFLCDLK
jgi:two-component system chemotaxis response regulator CheB